MAERGINASYPFAVQTPRLYDYRNEERFRAQQVQANAEIQDRLANLEQLVQDLTARIIVLEGGGP